jgi:hypothetical protein
MLGWVKLSTNLPWTFKNSPKLKECRDPKARKVLLLEMRELIEKLDRLSQETNPR